MHACIYTHNKTHIHTCMHTYNNTHIMHAYMHMHPCTCIHAHTYTIHTHTYSQTCTHTYPQPYLLSKLKVNCLQVPGPIKIFSGSKSGHQCMHVGWWVVACELGYIWRVLVGKKFLPGVCGWLLTL